MAAHASLTVAYSLFKQERFRLRVGYGRFVEVLKSLGQPSIELLKSVLNLVSKTLIFCNSQRSEELL